jgi:nucleolar protein 14
LITSLFPHILAISQAYPIPSAQYFNQKLALMHKNFTRGLSRGALRPEGKTWPGLAELFLLRMIGFIWPTSDLNHAVVSPTRMLLGAYLGLGRVRSLSDMSSGFFLCTLFLQFEALSKRFVPEVINFLVNSVLHLAPHQYQEIPALPGSFPSPDFRSDLRLSRNVQKGLVAQKPNLFSLLAASDLNEQSKVDLLGIALNLLGQFADMYKALDGFIELYEPILVILENIQSKYLPDGLGVSHYICFRDDISA